MKHVRERREAVAPFWERLPGTISKLGKGAALKGGKRGERRGGLEAVVVGASGSGNGMRVCPEVVLGGECSRGMGSCSGMGMGGDEE